MTQNDKGSEKRRVLGCKRDQQPGEGDEGGSMPEMHCAPQKDGVGEMRRSEACNTQLHKRVTAKHTPNKTGERKDE